MNHGLVMSSVFSMNSKSEICNLKPKIRGRRPGWTLVEMLVVSTVLTILLAIVATVTHTMYRAQRSTRHDVTSRRILTRLSLQLRDDVHAARQAKVGPAEGGEQTDLLSLERGPQQTIQYVFHSDVGEIERTVRKGETRVARDTFPLHHDSSATFGLVGQPTPRIVVMKITQLVVGDPDGGERTLQIQAALGLDGKHDGTQRAGGEQE
jgi:prepilin-type N-terminal cleavage/methylation domain-containing protein